MENLKHLIIFCLLMGGFIGGLYFYQEYKYSKEDEELAKDRTRADTFRLNDIIDEVFGDRKTVREYARELHGIVCGDPFLLKDGSRKRKYYALYSCSEQPSDRIMVVAEERIDGKLWVEDCENQPKDSDRCLWFLANHPAPYTERPETSGS